MFNVLNLMFLTKKRDDSAKARICVDGSKQEMDKSEVLAPTISTDELFITLVVNASGIWIVATSLPS